VSWDTPALGDPIEKNPAISGRPNRPPFFLSEDEDFRSNWNRDGMMAWL
jgi:hypothetical protein